MKKLKSILVFALFLLSLGAFAQTKSKVIALVTKADWCSTCKANGNRVVTEVLPLYQEPQVKIVVNDLTDKQTKATSNAILVAEGIAKISAKSNTTGQITFINASTKKVISKISVAKSNAEIKNAFDEAIRKS
jgi:hypothetical protein